MNIPFVKMHGAGNDFIVVDDRGETFPVSDKAFIQQLCHRQIGIGSDGIILIQKSRMANLRMQFINPDGSIVGMCGNGARCFARAAYNWGIVSSKMHIETRAGLVRAKVLNGTVQIDLTDPKDLKLDVTTGKNFAVDFVNTGVPHAVTWFDELEEVDVMGLGRELRNNKAFRPFGANVNFARVEKDGSVSIRTYERGVEAETLACGTGAAAVAVIAAERGRAKFPVTVHCAGGYDLVIDQVQGKTTLAGDAVVVFKGEVEYGDRV